MTFAVSLVITFDMAPKVIKTIRRRRIVGRDVNKKNKPEIPEMGGLSMVFGITISLLVVASIGEYFKMGFTIAGLYAAIGVFFISALIGIIDDLHGMVRSGKAVYMLIPAIPLAILQPGLPVIDLPFDIVIDLGGISLFYWFILVPLGITGAANALNMCAGYNGLESGSAAIISFFLLMISYFRDPDGAAVLIFAALLGGSIALYHFNKYPAKMFLGDVGVLTLGATLAAGTVIGNIEFYAILCILPAFYELFATLYYGILKGIERRGICHNPVILEDGRLKPPAGSERYTLAFLLLSKRPMTEKNLVGVMLSLFFVCGIIALILSMT